MKVNIFLMLTLATTLMSNCQIIVADLDNSKQTATEYQIGVLGIAGEIAPDGVTNKDLYDKYMENGIDITKDEYKEMRPLFQFRTEKETKDFILKIGLVPYTSDFKDADGNVKWDMKLNRGQYASVIRNFIDFYDIEKQPCCMGDNPDFKETPATDKYYNDIVYAATNGFYCTRNGSDGTKQFTVRELDKYLNKLVDDMPLSVSFYNNIYEDNDAYNNLLQLNYCIEKESDITKQTLTNLYRWNIMPRDKFYRVNLDKNINLYELTNILLGTGDLYRVYRSDAQIKSNCLYCTLSNIDQFYPEVYTEGESGE